MCDKGGTADNQKHQTCEGNANHSRAVPQGSAIKNKKTDTLEGIITQFENKMQQDKDLTYTEARHEIPTDNLKDGTKYNNGIETT